MTFKSKVRKQESVIKAPGSRGILRMEFRYARSRRVHKAVRIHRESRVYLHSLNVQVMLWIPGPLSCILSRVPSILFPGRRCFPLSLCSSKESKVKKTVLPPFSMTLPLCQFSILFLAYLFLVKTGNNNVKNAFLFYGIVSLQMCNFKTEAQLYIC